MKMNNVKWRELSRRPPSPVLFSTVNFAVHLHQTLLRPQLSNYLLRALRKRPALLESGRPSERLRVHPEGMPKDSKHSAIEGQRSGQLVSALVEVDEPDIQKRLFCRQSLLFSFQQSRHHISSRFAIFLLHLWRERKLPLQNVAYGF